MESNGEDILWSVGEPPPNKRRRVEYDDFYRRLETQHIGPLSTHNYSDFIEGDDFTENKQSITYYWNDETTFSNAEGSIPTYEAVGTYLH